VPPVSAPKPLPRPAPPIAAPAQVPPTVAIGQSSPRKDGVYVERLTITGSTRFSPKELAQTAQRAIAPASNPAKGSADPAFVNRRLSPAELVQASEAITKLYTGKGYINSGAYVPADVLNGGTPEIRIVEGRLESINVSVQPPGFLWLARPLSPKYVRRRLEKGIKTPLQIDQLIDVVKLLEQDPLITSISTELAPGATTGKSILNVKVRQATPLRVSAGIDNSRSPSVGRLQQQVSLSHANLLGLGDRLQVGFNRTEGSQGFNIGYALPINAKNGTLSFGYGNSRGQVIEEPFQDLDIKSRSQTYEIALRQPLKQTSTELFALTLRGTHYRSRGVFLESFNDGVAIPFPAQGSDENGETRVTAIRFGQEWTKRSEKDVISLQSEFSFGINALNATVLDTPPDGRFFAWQGRGFWVHAFAPDTLFALKGQVQVANRPLVPVEQISLGGLDTVRGYRTSTLLADSGWLASAEVYLPVLRIPKWQGVLQVIPFLDMGQGRNRGDFQPSPSKLLSTGLGLQWKMGDRFRARLDWGIPLINDRAENGRSLRENFFFSVIFTP
jgi:hemolysin activation/secretion protein